MRNAGRPCYLWSGQSDRAMELFGKLLRNDRDSAPAEQEFRRDANRRRKSEFAAVRKLHEQNEEEPLMKISGPR